MTSLFVRCSTMKTLHCFLRRFIQLRNTSYSIFLETNRTTMAGTALLFRFPLCVWFHCPRISGSRIKFVTVTSSLCSTDSRKISLSLQCWEKKENVFMLGRAQTLHLWSRAVGPTDEDWLPANLGISCVLLWFCVCVQNRFVVLIFFFSSDVA